MLAGTADLSKISVEEYLQIAFLHAMSNQTINIEQPVMYGGELYNLHFCMDRIAASESVASALEGPPQ